MSTCCDIGHPGPQGVLEDVIYPRGVDSARVIQVIETKGLWRTRTTLTDCYGVLVFGRGEVGRERPSLHQ